MGCANLSEIKKKHDNNVTKALSLSGMIGIIGYPWQLQNYAASRAPRRSCLSELDGEERLLISC
jgi:hypothetical protein